MLKKFLLGSILLLQLGLMTKTGNLNEVTNFSNSFEHANLNSVIQTSDLSQEVALSSNNFINQKPQIIPDDLKEVEYVILEDQKESLESLSDDLKQASKLLSNDLEENTGTTLSDLKQTSDLPLEEKKENTELVSNSTVQNPDLVSSNSKQLQSSSTLSQMIGMRVSKDQNTEDYSNTGSSLKHFNFYNPAVDNNEQMLNYLDITPDINNGNIMDVAPTLQSFESVSYESFPTNFMPYIMMFLHEGAELNYISDKYDELLISLDENPEYVGSFLSYVNELLYGLGYDNSDKVINLSGNVPERIYKILNTQEGQECEDIAQVMGLFAEDLGFDHVLLSVSNDVGYHQTNLIDLGEGNYLFLYGGNEENLIFRADNLIDALDTVNRNTNNLNFVSGYNFSNLDLESHTVYFKEYLFSEKEDFFSDENIMNVNFFEDINDFNHTIMDDEKHQLGLNYDANFYDYNSPWGYHHIQAFGAQYLYRGENNSFYASSFLEHVDHLNNVKDDVFLLPTNIGYSRSLGEQELSNNVTIDPQIEAFANATLYLNNSLYVDDTLFRLNFKLPIEIETFNSNFNITPYVSPVLTFNDNNITEYFNLSSSNTTQFKDIYNLGYIGGINFQSEINEQLSLDLGASFLQMPDLYQKLVLFSELVVDLDRYEKDNNSNLFLRAEYSREDLIMENLSENLFETLDVSAGISFDDLELEVKKKNLLDDEELLTLTISKEY